MTTINVTTPEEYETAVRGEPGKQTVVDFWAAWCGPCRAVSPILDQLEAEGLINLVKVDVDANPSLSEENEIMAIPTLMFYKDGKRSHDSLVGAHPRAEIVKHLGL